MAENDEYAAYVAYAAYVVALVAEPEHIAKEEDGLFPVSLTELTGERWNEAVTAWSGVHGRPVAPARTAGGAA
ncbi:hypothetical protein [Streptomyces sp. NPDC085466]|uniref:hypothetical protein n=1 Tax=Streptomyces sp. NPDC085466 TaxID=3365725 RepID=UPI0037CDC076